MSGLAVFGRVRAEHPQGVFVMVTGEADVRIGVQAMKQGAVDYIVKPFQIEAVVASLHRPLENKRLELELERHRQHLEELELVWLC